MTLELLRPDHGHEQVDEQQQGNEGDNHGFHWVLLQLLAEADVKGAHEKEPKGNSNIDQVTHRAVSKFAVPTRLFMGISWRLQRPPGNQKTPAGR
jgi:hypothetical protein